MDRRVSPLRAGPLSSLSTATKWPANVSRLPFLSNDMLGGNLQSVSHHMPAVNQPTIESCTNFGVGARSPQDSCARTKCCRRRRSAIADVGTLRRATLKPTKASTWRQLRSPRQASSPSPPRGACGEAWESMSTSAAGGVAESGPGLCTDSAGRFSAVEGWAIENRENCRGCRVWAWACDQGFMQNAFASGGARCRSNVSAADSYGTAHYSRLPLQGH